MFTFFQAATEWAAGQVDPLCDEMNNAENFRLWDAAFSAYCRWPWPVVQEVVPAVSAEEERAFFALELEDLPY